MNGLELARLEIVKKELKSEIERITAMQLEHYMALLKIGRDGRTEGLAWIVKTL